VNTPPLSEVEISETVADWLRCGGERAGRPFA